MHARFLLLLALLSAFFLATAMLSCGTVNVNVSIVGRGADKEPSTPPAEKKERPVEESEQRRVAVHEAGHAIVAAFLKGHDEVDSVVVYAALPENNWYGVCHTATRHRLDTADDIIRETSVYMGGRAADAIVNGAPTTGAFADLHYANHGVWHMHLKTGLRGSLMVREASAAPPGMAAAVEADLNAAYRCAEAIVTANRGLVAGLAARIMKEPVSDDKRTLSGKDFRAYLEKHPPVPPSIVTLPFLADACKPAPAR